jgi:hypothetical protein
VAHIYQSRVFETSTTTGTGALTLAGTAPTGFRPFSAVMAVSDTCIYLIQGLNGSGQLTSEWEIGIGTYSATNTLTRTTVLSSSNANAAVSFTSASLQVALAADAARVAQFDGVPQMRIPLTTSYPSTPAAGFLNFAAKESVGGVGGLLYKDAAGSLKAVQSNLSFQRFESARGGEAAPAVMGGIPSLTVTNNSAGSAPASTNLGTSLRNTVVASTTTAGTLGTQVSTPLRLWRGNAAGLGGFSYVERFSLTGTLQSGMRCFVGLADSVTALTNVDYTTATTPGKIGMAIIANSGNWNLVNNVSGTAPTVLGLGANFPVDNTTVYELGLYCVPNGSSIGYLVRNLTTGNETSGTLTTNIPASTTFLAPNKAITNNATAAAAQMRFYYWTIESDN